MTSYLKFVFRQYVVMTFVIKQKSATKKQADTTTELQFTLNKNQKFLLTGAVKNGIIYV